ncbi:MAG: hypothetical protein Q4G59_07760 [Planctomycetia bacterium]|nr:hypothetical protein [Planctomycetia bacterium]
MRIDRLRKEGGILCASENFFITPGSFIWQITRDGAIQFHLYCGSSIQSLPVNSAPCFTPRDFGTWVTLSAELDARTKTISLYRDDHMIQQVQWNEPIPLVPGRLVIGNITSPEKNSTGSIRSIYGAFAEFALFDK